jgi:hypothetical protein
MAKKAAKGRARVRDLKAKRGKAAGVKAGRQTPKLDFGDRMKAGLDTAAGIVASGANPPS